MQGYQKIDPCPYGDPKAAPNIEKAKQLIQEAGVAGQSVSVYGNDEERTRQVTEYLADVLEQIGLKPQLRIVNGDVYFQTVGNQKTKAAAGFTNWFQDYPHPYNFMFLIDGRSIQNTNNQNFGNVDDSGDQQDARRSQPKGHHARRRRSTPRSTRNWSSKAHVVPYGHHDPAVHHVGADRLRGGPVPPGAAGGLHDVRAEGVGHTRREGRSGRPSPPASHHRLGGSTV